MFTEREYAEFKQRAIELRKDRVYVVWRNPRLDLDCRIVGPSTQCMSRNSMKHDVLAVEIIRVFERRLLHASIPRPCDRSQGQEAALPS